MRAHQAARRILVDAIDHKAFPAASVEVGRSNDVLWREAFGRLTFDAGANATSVDTVFDLASLTKVVATATLCMTLVERRRISLEDPIAGWLPEWLRADRRDVTLADALLHATGLPAWEPLYRTCRGRPTFQHAIATTGLEYVPRTRSVYSDLGFMLLGFVLEDVSGLPLDRAFEALGDEMEFGEVRYLPPLEWLSRTAPTEYDPARGHLLVGEVHDENAAALGGVAAHAGLFGTATAVGRFAQGILAARRGDQNAVASRTLVEQFTTRGQVPGSSRALGWDTMLPTSSCGTKMSPLAFGHTGFTGTSLWIDPVRDLYIVLLTNHVHPSRNSDAIRTIRPAFHDAVIEAEAARLLDAWD